MDSGMFSYAGLLPRDKDGWDVSAVRQRNGNINLYRHGPEGDDHWGTMQKTPEKGSFLFRSTHDDTRLSDGFQGDEAGLFASVIRCCKGTVPAWAENDNLSQSEMVMTADEPALQQPDDSKSWLSTLRSGVDTAYERTIAWSNTLTLPSALKPYRSYIEKGLFLVAADAVAEHLNDEEKLIYIAQTIRTLLPRSLQFVMSEKRLLTNLQYLKDSLIEHVNAQKGTVTEASDTTEQSDKIAHQVHVISSEKTSPT